jgi:hypothetical protein
MMNAIATLGALVLVAVLSAGCGSGGGGHHATSVAPTPSESATAAPDPTPSATATSDPEVDEVVVGVGHDYGRPLPNGGTSIAIRHDGDGWERIPLTIVGDGAVYGVTFASATDVWRARERGRRRVAAEP